jgi:hypothetical protein
MRSLATCLLLRRRDAVVIEAVVSWILSCMIARALCEAIL